MLVSLGTTYLSHNAPFHSKEYIGPSNHGIKHLGKMFRAPQQMRKAWHERRSHPVGAKLSAPETCCFATSLANGVHLCVQVVYAKQTHSVHHKTPHNMDVKAFQTLPHPNTPSPTDHCAPRTSDTKKPGHLRDPVPYDQIELA